MTHRPHPPNAICGPEVLFETCVAMKFVDDDDDDDEFLTQWPQTTVLIKCICLHLVT